MRIAGVTHDGMIGVDAYTKQGAFVTQHDVDVAFDDGSFLRVPRGFVFDGASIPPRARSVIQSLTVAGNVLFCVHDYAYSKDAAWITPEGELVDISRERADLIALALCEWLRLDRDDQLEIYEALRLVGEFAFHKLPVGRTLAEWLARNA
jgi:hypothetical protein